jgi:hypothetical protein
MGFLIHALEVIEQGRLETAETEIQLSGSHARSRKSHGCRTAFSGRGVDERSTWVSEPEHLCALVECFACSIVDRSSHQVEAAMFRCVEEMRVPA